jgi:hypothetical protein
VVDTREGRVMTKARMSLDKEAAFRELCGEELASRRVYMLSNGYVPLPASDKGVFLHDWSKLDENGNQCGVDPTLEEIDRWSVEYPDWQNTSVRCGEVVAIDCDILDKDVADRVREAARRCFGKAFPTRVGNPPKFLMMCRTPEPFSKLRTGKYLQPDGGTSQVEVLCNGQQFVAYGIHPKTGKAYEWFGGDPLSVPVADLPEVGRDNVVEFLRAAEAILSSQPDWTVDPKAGRANYADAEREEHQQKDYVGEPTDWTKLQRALDSLTDVSDYETFYRIVAALKDGTDNPKRALALAFRWASQYPDLFDPVGLKKKWDSFKRGSGVGLGTIYHLAREAETRNLDPSGLEKSWLPAEPWWRDPGAIPKREWLYVGKHYMRGDISATIAPGGLAKTTRGVQEAVDMAANYGLRVLLLNGEEDQDELDRRIAAACAYYSKTRDDLGGRLFAVSCRAKPPRFAITGERGVAQLNHEALGELEAFVKENKIDAFMLDPLISFHRVSENLNEHMDLLLKEGLGGVASRAQAAGEVFHHVGKPKPGANETTVEDARGASAILAAVRSARVLNRMTEKEARALGLIMNDDDMRRRHIRIGNGKANKAPVGKAVWMRIEVETLPNGDEIAVTRDWTPPASAGLDPTIVAAARLIAQTGTYRVDKRSPKWFGYALASKLGLTVVYGVSKSDETDSKQLDAIVKTLFKMGAIAIEERKDDHREARQYVIAGPEAESVGASTDPESIFRVDQEEPD